jgi:hypothetical protein
MIKPSVPKTGLAVCLGFLLQTSLALAQSPVPFAWVDTAVPDTIGAPIGFGDVDGDGSPDLIVIAYGGTPAVLRNDGHGRFTPATSFASAAGVPMSAIADFNLDGRADVALVAGGTTGSVSIYFGSAAGVLTLASTQPLVDAASVASGDVNGDGAPDLVFGTIQFLTFPCTQNCLLATASVVLLNANDGTGTLTPAGTLGLPILGNSRVAFTDIDLDGDQDLVTSSGGTVFNNGGTFGTAVNVVPSVGAVVGATTFVARFDNDSYPDVLVTAGAPGSGLYHGGLAGLTLFDPGPTGSTGAPLDVNGDGIDEVITSEAGVTTVYSVGAGGGLTPLITLPRIGGPLLVRDVDGDGDQDVLIHENTTRVNTLYFGSGAGGLYEQGPPYQPRFLLGRPAPADLNGDGAPEIVSTVFDVPVKLAIATNDGVGRFSWSTVQPTGASLFNGQTLVLPADLDADGDKDLVLIEMVSTAGHWTFKSRTVTNGGGSAWSAGIAVAFSTGTMCDASVADMNGDGTEDIVFGDDFNGTRIIYSFAGTPSLPGTVISPILANEIELADIDGDGDKDVAVAGFSVSHLLINQGGGVFTQDQSFPFVQAEFCTVGDVSGDGLPDCYLNNHLYLQQSGGSWAYYGDVPTGLFGGGTIAEVRSWDFDGDGDIDTVTGAGLAYVNQGGSATAHLLTFNQSGSGQHLVPVDLDRDGDLDLLTVRRVAAPGNYNPTNGTACVLFNTARQLTIEAPVRPGHLTHMGFRGAPGGTWFLFASTGLASIAAPPFGTILIDPVPALQVATGTLDSSGAADWNLLLPASFSIYVGAEFDDQAFVDTVAGPRITNARRVVITSY